MMKWQEIEINIITVTFAGSTYKIVNNDTESLLTIFSIKSLTAVEFGRISVIGMLLSPEIPEN